MLATKKLPTAREPKDLTLGIVNRFSSLNEFDHRLRFQIFTMHRSDRTGAQIARSVSQPEARS